MFFRVTKKLIFTRSFSQFAVMTADFGTNKTTRFRLIISDSALSPFTIVDFSIFLSLTKRETQNSTRNGCTLNAHVSLRVTLPAVHYGLRAFDRETRHRTSRVHVYLITTRLCYKPYFPLPSRRRLRLHGYDRTRVVCTSAVSLTPREKSNVHAVPNTA